MVNLSKQIPANSRHFNDIKVVQKLALFDVKLVSQS